MVSIGFLPPQDWWTFEIIVMLSGLLPRPDVTMSMMGITFNVHALCFFAAHGLSGAASTRVGNELGARPELRFLTVLRFFDSVPHARGQRAGCILSRPLLLCFALLCFALLVSTMVPGS